MDEQQSKNTSDEQDLFVSEEIPLSTETPDSEKKEIVAWTASEFMHHQKSSIWYITAVLILILGGGAVFIVSGDIFTPAAVIVLGIILMIGASKKPRTINYEVDQSGITMGKRLYTYNDFVSFSVVQEGPIESIVLIPQQRWSPIKTLYFMPEDGQAIFDIISQHLPIEERDKDPIDKLLNKIRF